MTPASRSRSGFHAEVADVARMFDARCRDRWWLIGSSALALSIADAAAPADIDVLASRRDAEAVIAFHRDLVDAAYRPADDGRFRSTFARFRLSPLAVEVMGGLEVRRGDRWAPVTVEEDRTVDCAGAAVRVPTRCEQIRLFELFGRDKDLAKARRLRDRIADEAPHAVLG